MVDHRLPSEWQPYRNTPALQPNAAGQVQVLPLVPAEYRSNLAGWCTSGWLLQGSPEVEVMCGGINTKTPSHAGIWRQGNLLHFGFEPAPSEMNEQGRALLINSVAYISRFTEDMPLTRTKSVFADDNYPRSTLLLDELVGTSSPAQLSKGYISAALGVARMTPVEFKAWYAENRPYMHAGDLGLIDVDREAKSFGVPPSDPRLLAEAIDALGKRSQKRESAQTLLARYVAQPPENIDSHDAWVAWYAENRDFLFFNEVGGYKWFIDTLAKRRGVQTADLRGPARATLPPPGYVEN